MVLANSKKQTFICTIRNKLLHFQEIKKVILFGSFLNSDDPKDIDIAIIHNSNEDFLALSLKYRKTLRELAKQIPIDIVPIKQDAKGVFLDEINKGQIVYER